MLEPLSKSEPFFFSSLSRSFDEMRQQMERLFNGSVRTTRDISPSTNVLWIPTMDVSETSDELILHAELPGIEQKDISLNVEDNTLVIRGERKFENDQKDANYHWIERSY